MIEKAKSAGGAFSAFARGAQALTLKSMSRLFPEKVVRSVMSNIKVGSIEVETPDGAHWTLGTPGASPRCSIRIRRSVFFDNLVRYWDVGLGESYQEGDYEVDDLVAFLRIIILNIPHLPGISGSEATHPDLNREQEDNLRLHRTRGNTLRGSKANIAYHYDLSNELYQLFLDPSMAYSSAVFRRPEDTLHEAQIHKFDLLCRKLELKPGEHVLEIGSGWGGFAIHAARN